MYKIKSKIVINKKAKSTQYELLNGGVITIPGNCEATEINLKLLLPRKQYLFVIYGKEDFEEADYYAGKIAKITEENRSVTLKIDHSNDKRERFDVSTFRVYI